MPTRKATDERSKSHNHHIIIIQVYKIIIIGVHSNLHLAHLSDKIWLQDCSVIISMYVDYVQNSNLK